MSITQNQHNEYQEVIIDSADGIDSGSGTSSGGSHYLATYRRWERQAENAYDSLTHASVSSSTYIRNKKLLRDAQNEMRKVRRQAVTSLNCYKNRSLGPQGAVLPYAGRGNSVIF